MNRTLGQLRADEQNTRPVHGGRTERLDSQQQTNRTLGQSMVDEQNTWTVHGGRTERSDSPWWTNRVLRDKGLGQMADTLLLPLLMISVQGRT